ncbi:MAG TPA: hypothetical protein VJA17_01200 [Candidatus Omnitrophota bacterium]|nr:hypothetical protein [Candidatus Omnitrophota bacterium]
MKSTTQKITISVIGGHEKNQETEKLAYAVGKKVAEAGAVLVCGGLDGAMSAAVPSLIWEIGT